MPQDEYVLKTDKTVKALADVTRSLGKVDTAARNLNKVTAESVSVSKRQIDWLTKLRDQVKRNGDLLITNSKNLRGNTTQLRANTVATEAATKESSQLRVVLGDLISQQAENVNIHRQSVRIVEELAVNTNSLVVLMSKYAKEVNSVVVATRAENVENKKKKQALKDLREEQSRLAREAAIAASQERARIGQTGVTALQTSAPLRLNSQAAINEAIKIEESLRRVAMQSNITEKELTNIVSAAAIGRLQQFPPHLRAVGVELTTLVARYRQLEATQNQWALSGVESIQKVSLSWRAYARFFATHLAYRAFSEAASAMREGITAAADLEFRIAEIRTISQDSTKSVSDWAGELRSLSDAFPQSTLEIAEATYQALSNQVVKAGEATGFMRQSLRLAITTVAQGVDAVNALSSIINSYGEEAGKAEVISGQLFKTIELGRIRLNEISNDIGNVTILAAQLGISFSEVGASLATITNQGVKPATAMTFLRNVMLKLIKPSESMVELFREWGYETVEQGLKAEGLFGIFTKLEKVTRGSATEIAELFTRIRATVGATSLFGNENLPKFADNFQKILFESAASYDEATKRSFDIPARRAEIEIQKLKNVFINDVGRGIIATTVEITDKMGGLSNVVIQTTKWVVLLGAALTANAVTKKAILKYTAITAAIEKMRQATALTAAAELALQTNIAGVVAGIAALAASYLYLRERQKQAAEDSLKESAERYRISREIQVQEKLVRDQRLQYFDDIKKAEQDALTSLATLRKGVFKELEEIEKRWEKATAAVDRSLQALSASVNDRQLQEYNKQLEELAGKQLDLTISADTRTFVKEIEDLRKNVFREPENFFDVKIVNKYRKEIERLREVTNTLYDEGNINDARKYFDETIKLAQELSKALDDPKTRKGFVPDSAVKASKELINELLDEQIGKEKELTRIVKERIAAEEASIVARKAAVDRIFDVYQNIKDFEDKIDAPKVDLDETLKPISDQVAPLQAQLKGIAADLQSLGVEGIAAGNNIANAFNVAAEKLAKTQSLSAIDKSGQAITEITNNVSSAAEALSNETEKLKATIDGLVTGFSDDMQRAAGALSKETAAAIKELQAKVGGEGGAFKFDASLENNLKTVRDGLTARLTVYENNMASILRKLEEAENNLTQLRVPSKNPIENALRPAAIKDALNEIAVYNQSVRELQDEVAKYEQTIKRTDEILNATDVYKKQQKNLDDLTSSSESATAKIAKLRDELVAAGSDAFKIEQVIANNQEALGLLRETNLVGSETVASIAGGTAAVIASVKAGMQELSNLNVQLNNLVALSAVIEDATAFASTGSAATQLSAQKEIEISLTASNDLLARIAQNYALVAASGQVSVEVTTAFESALRKVSETLATAVTPIGAINDRIQSVRDSVNKIAADNGIILATINQINPAVSLQSSLWRTVDTGVSNVVLQVRSVDYAAQNLNRTLSQTVKHVQSINFQNGGNAEIFTDGPPPNPFTQNPRGFASGGPVPGNGVTDSVPAMLTPGEYVIRRDAAKQNKPLLAAINSKNRNNATNNVSTDYGGFNISLNTSGSKFTSQDVQAIGEAIRREVRRGALKL